MEPGETFEIGDIRDQSNKCNRDGPEDNQSCDETNDCHSANNALPPGDFQRFPDNFVGIDTDKLGGH